MSSPDALLTRVSVKNGRLVMPDGMSYRVLVLPATELMPPRVLRKIKELADAGATIITEGKPPIKSPSFANLGAGDAEVKKLADELWPKLITGKIAPMLLAERGTPADFATSSLYLRHLHRTVGDTDIYFVANPEPRELETLATFRVSGKTPEFWNAEAGRVVTAPSFTDRKGVTSVPLQLGPIGSLFVVFRPTVKAVDPVVAVTRDNQPVLPGPGVNARKIVVTQARYGVLDDLARTREVRGRAQQLVDPGKLLFHPAELSKNNDPAKNVVKAFVIDYTLDGQPGARAV